MWEVRPEYGKKSPRGPSHSFGNLKIAICLVGYANDRLIDQRFPYVTNYANTRHLPFRIVTDTDGSLARRFFNVEMTPTTYLVDRNGKILKRFLGEPDFAALDRMISDALTQST
jgi:hypothetical protein